MTNPHDPRPGAPPPTPWPSQPTQGGYGPQYPQPPNAAPSTSISQQLRPVFFWAGVAAAGLAAVLALISLDVNNYGASRTLNPLSAVALALVSLACFKAHERAG
jgi:hypothetical protein